MIVCPTSTYLGEWASLSLATAILCCCSSNFSLHQVAIGLHHNFPQSPQNKYDLITCHHRNDTHQIVGAYPSPVCAVVARSLSYFLPFPPFPPFSPLLQVPSLPWVVSPPPSPSLPLTRALTTPCCFDSTPLSPLLLLLLFLFPPDDAAIACY